jgi:hypothetical protein
MFRLKKWKLLPEEKKEEAGKNNISGNTIIEDKKEPENVIIAPEYTKLTNEKEPSKRKRRTAKNDE